MLLLRTIALIVSFVLTSGPTSLAGADAAAVCKQKKAKAAGNKVGDLVKAFGLNCRKPNALRLASDVSKAQSKFTSRFAKADSKGGCLTTGDAATVEAVVDAFVADAVAKVSIRRGQEFRVNDLTPLVQEYPAAAMSSDGDFVVAWTEELLGGSDRVVARRFDSDGTPLSGDFQVSLAVFPIGGVFVGVDGDGGFVVVWTSEFFDADGDGDGVFARRFDGSGSPLGGPFQVNVATTGDQEARSIAVGPGGDFIVVWDGQDGSAEGVMARQFDSAGVALGGEFQVNVHTTGVQQSGLVARFADGSFIVTWGGNLLGSDAFARRFDSNGAPLSGEFQVSAYTTGVQIPAAIGIDGGGKVVIMWNDYLGRDGDLTGVFARRFDSSGTPLGDDFQVNTFTHDRQVGSGLGVAADGAFIITWDGSGNALDGDTDGVFAQLYDNTGAPRGTQFQVNTYTTGTQNFPRVAMNADGDFVVVWDGSGQGDDRGVHAQRFVLTP